MLMKITIAEIAQKAGVSKTTVSRVLNNQPDVDAATRERIMGLIAQYGFQPNAFAKAISLQKSDHIGLLIPHKAEYVFSNPFYTEVMRGVSTEVDAQEYYLLFCYAHEDNYLDIFRQKRVDGFILLSPGSFHKHIIETLNAQEVPFVSTAIISAEAHMTYVDVDNFRGAVTMMEHLTGLGHQRIAYVGKPTLKSSQDRLNGYRHVMARYGLPSGDEWVLIPETSSVESGHDAALRFLQRPTRPTALFMANDIMAIGAIRAIQESGLRVPEDISVAGFDDIPLARYTVPPITTVRQPAYEKGVQAARLLIQMLEKTGGVPQSLVLPTELVVRQSTGPAQA
jgi:LacI family transcriptional regulator